MGSLPDLPADRIGFRIPESLLTDWLPRVDNLASLKIVLYAYWIWHNSEAEFPVFDSKALHETLEEEHMSPDQIQAGLKVLLSDGIFINPEPEHTAWKTALVLNTPLGQAALEAIRSGTLVQAPIDPTISPKTSSSGVSIYQLYEENIGVITPILAESLRDLESEYSLEWISEAFTIAAKQNVRNLRYIEAILERWRKEGKNDRTDRRGRKKAEEKYRKEGYTDDQFPGLLAED